MAKKLGVKIRTKKLVKHEIFGGAKNEQALHHAFRICKMFIVGYKQPKIGSIDN